MPSSPRSSRTSNITYRIYDYNRKVPTAGDAELHTELAKDAIDYTFQSDYRTHYTATTGRRRRAGAVPVLHHSLAGGKHL